MLGKLMESILRDAIVDHLTANELLKDTQHGFMRARSCLTNLLEYLETLTKLLDEGKAIDIIYCDFSKAFDKVAHGRLLTVLKSHGIVGEVLDWISQWLSGRKQRVVLNGHTSEWQPVSSGVPQGSCLGPTLFLIFINSIDDCIDKATGIISKFADDTKVGRVIETESDHEKLQEEIDNLVDWADTWNMQFNPQKCKVLHFGRSNPRYNYVMGGYAPAGEILDPVTEEKDVGVVISETLKPALQCARAAKRANAVLGQMKRAFTYRDKTTWVKLYKVYVRPHLEYCVQAWSPYLEKDRELLEAVQKRAVRMIKGLKGKTYEERLQECNLTSLTARRQRGDLLEVWKILNGKDDLDAKKMFRFAASGAVRDTRMTTNPLNLEHRKFRLDVRKQFFSVRTTKTWNALPDNVRQAPSLDVLKQRYDLHVASCEQHLT